MAVLLFCAAQPPSDDDRIGHMLARVQILNIRKQVGTLELKIRVRTPLTKPEIEVTQEKVLVFDEHFPLADPTHAAPEGHVVLPASAVMPAYTMTEAPAQQLELLASSSSSSSSTSSTTPAPAPATPAPAAPTAAGLEATTTTSTPSPSPTTPTATAAETPAAAATAAAPAASTPAPTAAGAQKKSAAVAADINETDYNAVDFLISDKVLEWALAVTDKEIALARSKKQPIDDLQIRKQQIQMKQQLLIISIQTEKLTFEDYTASLQAKIQEEKQLAKQLAKAGREDQARLALTRAALMEKELAETDEEQE